MQATSSGSLTSRHGIGTIVIVIVLIIIVVVAGAGYYYVTVVSSTSTSTGQSSTQTSTASSSSTPTTTTTSFSISTTTKTTTTASSGVKTYSATFNYTQPLGPFGELTYSNNDTVKTYTSVQVASGSFTFSINPSTYTGTGSGQGTLTVTTTGFCSGRTTVPYTFQIPDATTILGGNITVFIGTPTPANFSVHLTCTATATAGSTNGDIFPFLSTYPNEINVRSVPVTISQHLPGNINYYFNIKQTS
jgi:flagellar basal body-associated protein FliL